jgi:hypothetical protein
MGMSSGFGPSFKKFARAILNSPMNCFGFCVDAEELYTTKPMASEANKTDSIKRRVFIVQVSCSLKPQSDLGIGRCGSLD